MSAKTILKAAGAGLIVGALLVISVGLVLGDEGRIVGTKHDVATPGSAVCVYCHIPKDPDGEVLWAADGRPDTGDTFSGIKPLCFSCHDGTVAASSYTYVFDLDRPEHPRTPGARGQDCDRCHDPHRTGYGKFLKISGGANFCQNCHLLAGPTNHPTGIDPKEAGFPPADTTWDPHSGDFSGTRLWAPDGLQPGNLLKCLTCHAPHGGQPDTLMNTVAFERGGDSPVYLCESCHSGIGND